ncbi:MBOAT family protein [Crocinitomicaceae bacterium CZZ-1]|uniref:MBOAT family protein n=1 Tax=Taishania pollutisoli TaxID=2766479 RepID=A0A8J6PDQ3_9FLAO|nr:MBOAT family protein [Taishania pollutisoli]
MVFSSIFFLLYFLPIFLLGYHFIDKKYKNYWILASSIFFYAWGAPKFIFVVLAAAIVDYSLVNKMHAVENRTHKKRWLVFSLLLNIGLLAYFKYANFFIENVNALLEAMGVTTIAWTEIALPIGISFYIFQSITYAVDVYRGVNPPVKNFSLYLLFILSFPQMIAGPIVKFNHIAHQLANRDETADDRLLGFYRFCIGLGKKVLIANVLAVYADRVLNGDLHAASSAAVWMGIIAYTFQIYFDFSGYSDMAIGLGRMIGFKFPENFDSPYLSATISEFWRRWHMTLGGFMKEYLYIPLGGSRGVSKNRVLLNLGIVFLLSGLWHGASWNFILWGAFHGLFLILDRLFLIRLLNKLGTIVSVVVTFFIVVVGWAIFRMEDFDAMKLVLEKMFSFEAGTAIQLSLEYWVVLAVAVFFSVVTAFRFGKMAETFFLHQETASVAAHFTLFVIAVALLMLSISGIAASGFNPFIYYRF